MELAPFIGASVFVNGMPKATAGSEGKALPLHIPIDGVFVPPPPGNECEMHHLAESGLVVKVVDALGNISSTEYNEFNEVAKSVDELGHAILHEYDDRGDLLKRVGPDGGDRLPGW